MAIVSIPSYITVHLGAPDSDAENIVVPYTNYLKIAASAEIYPTWPQESLSANIYAINTFALNRIFTEYYRSRGYDFDITNNTAYDQAFVVGGDIFDTISDIVDFQFNDYIVRGAQVQPLYSSYCSGRGTTCNGLSQWGSVYLAYEGYDAITILRSYYGDDVAIVYDAPVQGIQQSYPGIALRLGSAGEEVRTIQRELNRISLNYPAIPKTTVNLGIFDAATRRAVIAFQQIFGLTVDGIVGKATWYKIKSVYNAVKRLSEIYSEGISASEAERLYSSTLRQGDTGIVVRLIQYYLAFLGFFDDELPEVEIDGYFGPLTRAAVEAFQRQQGLTVDGIVGRNTWNTMQRAYSGILNALPDEYRSYSTYLYPGYYVTTGSSGTVVERLQTFLRTIGENDYRVPLITVDGIYGPQTALAVETIQGFSGLPETGEVGPLTWNTIVNLYNEYK